MGGAWSKEEVITFLKGLDHILDISKEIQVITNKQAQISVCVVPIYGRDLGQTYIGLLCGNS